MLERVGDEEGIPGRGDVNQIHRPTEQARQSLLKAKIAFLRGPFVSRVKRHQEIQIAAYSVIAARSRPEQLQLPNTKPPADRSQFVAMLFDQFMHLTVWHERRHTCIVYSHRPPPARLYVSPYVATSLRRFRPPQSLSLLVSPPTLLPPGLSSRYNYPHAHPLRQPSGRQYLGAVTRPANLACRLRAHIRPLI